MSSGFDDMVAADVPMLMGDMGETVAINSQVGGLKNIDAIVQRETRHVVSMGSVDLDHDEMIIDSKTTFTDGSAYTAKEFGEDGNAGDSLTIDGETWYLAEILGGRKAYAGLYSLRLKTKKVSDSAA